MSARPTFASVPDYLSALEPSRSRVLKRVLGAVRKSVPDSTPVISYGIPAFKQHRVFIYCAAFKRHIGIYPPVRDPRLKAALARRPSGGRIARFAGRFMQPGKGLLFVLVVACAAAFVCLTSIRLPAEVASHFGGSGAANGFMPHGFYVRQSA